MSHYLIGVDDSSTDFTFGRTQLVDALTSRWPDAETIDDPVPGSAAGLAVYLPEDAHRQPEITWFEGGIGVSVDADDQALAAEIIALLTNLPGFPAAGGVLLTDWADNVLPLEPRTTPEELLELAT